MPWQVDVHDPRMVPPFRPRYNEATIRSIALVLECLFDEGEDGICRNEDADTQLLDLSPTVDPHQGPDMDHGTAFGAVENVAVALGGGVVARHVDVTVDSALCGLWEFKSYDRVVGYMDTGVLFRNWDVFVNIHEDCTETVFAL